MQTEMNKLFAEGGVMQQGGTVDPVSGNDVPPGAMAEEVRDDIDAKLSEGEFVIPADVVRYIGLEKLMMMRDKAKRGLQKMAEIGQMGNAEEVSDGEALFGGEEQEDEMDDDAFSSEIDSIMGEDNGGEEDRGYADGGYVVPENREIYSDAPMKGFEMVPMTNDAGQTIFIPFINGVAQLNIPTGYKVKKAGVVEKPVEEKPVEAAPIQTGGDSGGGDGGVPTTTSGGGFGIGSLGMGDVSISPEGVVSGGQVSGKGMAALGAVVGSLLGFGPVIGAQAGKALGKNINTTNAATIAASNAAIQDTMGVNATNVGGGPTAITAEEAGRGVEGVTGGSAAAAGAAAAAAAASQGAAAQGAAAQAAANAALGGASSSEAAAAGAAAANSVQAAETGMTTNAQGQTVSSTESIAAQDAATFGDSGGVSDSSGQGTNADGGYGSGGFGESDNFGGFAKGGFVSKPKKTKSKPKGLAGRR